VNELVSPSKAAMERAATALRMERLVCFPTDTLFALACLAQSAAARGRFYAAKERDPARPSILMLASAADAEPWVRWTSRAEALAASEWPGPLTLVLAATPIAVEDLGEVVYQGTIALRVPRHPVALDLLTAVGMPLATASANIAGAPPPRTGAEAAAALPGRVDLVLDGDCALGVASSILDLSGPEPRVIREGAIPAERLLS
jgi:L-threonylcarbamoyladenylate synthase